MGNFSHRHVYIVCFYYPMSIMAIDPVLPQAILPIMVTLFPFGMVSVTNIPSINVNDTSFYSELNGEHAGENSMSLRLMVFVIRYCNFEKSSIWQKIDF